MAICDKDCFNCKFDDCVVDELPDEELQDTDKVIFNEAELKILKRRERNRRYYHTHKEQCKQAMKRWNEAHAEEVKAHKRKYWRENYGKRKEEKGND